MKSRCMSIFYKQAVAFMGNETVRNIEPVCPVCECSSGAYSVAVGSYRVTKCQNCGLEYTTPSPTDEDLNRFYCEYVDIRADPQIVTINAKRNLELLKSYGLNEDSSLLDFGCGNGEFVDIAGDRCFGIELSRREGAARVFNDINALPVEFYDFITLWGVLEHLNDPVRSIKELTKKINPRGHIVITTVNAEGNIPYYYKPPEHLTYWTEKSIRYLFEKSNLEIKAVQPYEMCQLSEVYLDRLLSRTPEQYREAIASSLAKLPRIITVPTNEFLVVAEFV